MKHEPDDHPEYAATQAAEGETPPVAKSSSREQTGSGTAIADAPAAGTPIDRYVLLEPIGQGGMGTVYAAYDPRLDRKVAVKLLRTGAGDIAKQRLVREARAMAKLSHNNVLTVLDAGTWRNDVFIAVELVEGADLRAWLDAEERSWHAVVEVFIEAGKGLAAAHEAKLIHRDFKPDNVLVDNSGRVRVADFGLARMSQHRDSEAESEPAEPARPDGEPTEQLTQAGAILGTPLYMSPERFTGNLGDERSDQYAFGVSLYGALFQDTPFPTDRPEPLIRAITRGEVLEPTSNPLRVPAWLQRVVMRTLARDPDDRYPSMQALLAALQRKRRRTVLWVLAGAACLVAAAAAVVALGALQPRATAASYPLCEPIERDASTLWSDERRQTIAAALGRAAPSHGDVHAIALEHLDRYVQKWQATYLEACGALEAHSALDATLGYQLQCLRRKRNDLAVLIEMLVSQDPSVAENASIAVWELGATADCTPTRETMVQGAVRDDRETPEQERLRAGLIRARVKQAIRQHKDALQLVADTIESARASGHRALLAEAIYRLADLEYWDRQYQQSIATARQSIAEGIAVGRDDLVAKALSVMALSASNHWGDTAVARDAIDRLNGYVERLGRPPELERTYLMAAARLHRRQKNIEQAYALWRRAAELVPNDRVQVHLEKLLANAASDLGMERAALSHKQNRLRVVTRNLGARHILTARAKQALSTTLVELGDYRDALAHAEDALSIVASDPTIPPKDRAEFQAVVAVSQALLGQTAEARAMLEPGLKAVTGDLYYEPMFLAHLGRVALLDGDYQDAVDVLRRAEEQADAKKLRWPNWASRLYTDLALALIATERPDRALAELSSVLPALRQRLPKSLALAKLLAVSALAHTRVGRGDDARRLADEAKQMAEAIRPNHPEMSRLLAQARDELTRSKP